MHHREPPPEWPETPDGGSVPNGTGIVEGQRSESRRWRREEGLRAKLVSSWIRGNSEDAAAPTESLRNQGIRVENRLNPVPFGSDPKAGNQRCGSTNHRGLWIGTIGGGEAVLRGRPSFQLGWTLQLEGMELRERMGCAWVDDRGTDDRGDGPSVGEGVTRLMVRPRCHPRCNQPTATTYGLSPPSSCTPAGVQAFPFPLDPLSSLRDAEIVRSLIRWCRFVQPPATGLHASGMPIADCPVFQEREVPCGRGRFSRGISPD